MRTKRQLVTAALRDLRLTALGETPAAEDFELGVEKYDTKLEELREKGLAWWPNTAGVAASDTLEIPDSVFLPLTRVMIGELAGPFGKDTPVEQDDAGRPMAVDKKGLMDLRRHMSKRDSGEPTTAEYF